MPCFLMMGLLLVDFVTFPSDLAGVHKERQTTTGLEQLLAQGAR